MSARMGRNRKECCIRRDGDVVCRDRYGEDVTIGSIVEIVPMPSDRYKGLYFVYAFEVGDRGLRVLVSQTRDELWEFKVATIRIVLRCYAPIRVKGE
jgi:hypothetical protein